MTRTAWPADCYRHRPLKFYDYRTRRVECDVVVYGDPRMNLPSHSVWMIPGTHNESEAQQ